MSANNAPATAGKRGNMFYVHFIQDGNACTRKFNELDSACSYAGSMWSYHYRYCDSMPYITDDPMWGLGPDGNADGF
jgi:hypothetical protein